MLLNRVLTLAGVVGCLWASSANADTVFISARQDANGFVSIGSGTGIASATAAQGSNAAFLDFGLHVTATGNPPLVGSLLLDTNTISITSTGGHTLDIAISEILAGPVSAGQAFLSSFTTNLLTAGWTVTMQTFVGATLLVSQTLNGDNQTFKHVDLGPAGTTVSEMFHITTGNSENRLPGQTNSTIDLATVPVPAALPLFASGLLGLWAVSRRRRKVQPTFA